MAVASQNHRRFGPDWYCPDHGSTFEQQELDRNEGDCPWCGDPVEG
jgi:rubrerythrin